MNGNLMTFGYRKHILTQPTRRFHALIVMPMPVNLTLAITTIILCLALAHLTTNIPHPMIYTGVLLLKLEKSYV